MEYYFICKQVNDQIGSEVIEISAKTGKTICIVLNPKEEQIVNELAMELLKKTGKFSKSEAARQLIVAGAKTLVKEKS